VEVPHFKTKKKQTEIDVTAL